MHQEASASSGSSEKYDIDLLSPNNPFHLTQTDLHILSQSDIDYKRLSWSSLKAILAANELEKLTRTPSQLRSYLIWSAKTRDEYGTIPNFILKNRLGWDRLPSDHSTDPPMFAVRNPVPFADRADFRILRNDWPYGFEDGIIHICVWLKTPLPVSPQTGELTADGRSMVQKFVEDEFELGLGIQSQDRVFWFKNFTVLQSVRAIEHFHVLLRLEGGDSGLHGRLDRLLQDN